MVIRYALRAGKAWRIICFLYLTVFPSETYSQYAAKKSVKFSVNNRIIRKFAS